MCIYNTLKMKNLELFHHFHRRCEQFSNARQFCVNPLENTVYVYDNGIIYNVPQDVENIVEVYDLRKHCSDELTSEVVGMGMSCAQDGLCLGTWDGSLLSVTLRPFSVEVVGCFSQGLRCLQWSPDEELLLLVTGDNTVMAMSLCWDLLWERSLWQTEAHVPVTVGWGSKETQFHGSEGKSARSIVLPQEAPSPRDDGSVRISWRGDGLLVAISVIKPETGARCIKIFGRDGTLQATSEPVSCLEMNLAWRPSSNLIASTQVLPNKYQVVFFEKNGLRHGEFTLPFPPGEGVVRQLAWNTESDVLSVWYEDAVFSHLLLCTMGNYHWYVKQSYVFLTKNHLQVCVWDPEARLKMHLIYGLGMYAVHEWIWNVTCSSPYAENNRAEVAVIDGSKILLTAFAEKTVPPPMCAEHIILPKRVNQVVFGPVSCPDSILCVLCDGTLCLFEGRQRELRWTRRVRVDIAGVGDPLVLHHWLWPSAETVVALATVGTSSRLVCINIATEVQELTATEVEVDLEGAVLTLTLVGNGSEGDVVLQTDSGNFLLWNLRQSGHSFGLQPLHSCPERLIKVLALPTTKGVPYIVGLSVSSRLFLGNQEEASNVTSMLLLPGDLLLITTSAHTLLCLDLKNGCTASPVSEAMSRRVERGSRLVTAAPPLVVLQMPRGNLESISPRALVLRQAAQYLDEARFTSVFELFRKERISLNLLVDHNPELFIANVDTFVRGIKVPSWLSIFVVELLEEDVTQTTYATFYHSRPRPSSIPWAKGSKKETVCKHLYNAMMKASSEGCVGLLIPRLTTLVVGGGGGEAGLQSALKALQSTAAALGPEQGSATLDEGVRHLLTLCDATALFKAALATYDLQLAARVATRSNRDPKEYLPFLNELQRLDEYYRCYHIDTHLNRLESAISHLAKCPEHFDEFLSVMQDNNLYAKALSQFHPGQEQYKKVAALYGEYLLRERKMEEATVMLRRAGQVEDALEACRLSGDWHQALVLLIEGRLTPEERMDYLRQLTATLVLQRRFREAAQLLQRECGDAEEAVRVLIQGRLWAEARQLASILKHTQYNEHIETAIVENFEQLLSEITSHKSTYEKHLDRLRIVRAEKLNRPQEKEVEGAESDLFSDASSTSGSGSDSFHSSRSGRSGRSSRSGKNKRKQERKMLSLKEGAPMEDLALLRAMHQIATTCFALRREVRELCLVLLSLGEHDREAVNLQASLAATLQLVEGSREEVWPPELSSPNAHVNENERYGPDATVNSIVSGNQKVRLLVQNCELLEPQYRIPPLMPEHLNWKLSILNM